MNIKITEKISILLSIFFILVNLICPIHSMADTTEVTDGMLNYDPTFLHSGDNSDNEEDVPITKADQIYLDNKLEEKGVSKEDFEEWYGKKFTQFKAVGEMDDLIEYCNEKNNNSEIGNIEDWYQKKVEKSSKEDNEQSEQEEKDDKDSGTNGKSEIVKIIKNAVAKWYYVMRLIVIAFMLVLLIFIGIKMALSTISSEKAVYKQMLVDWVAGMILIFSIHYIMIFILNINDTIVSSLENFKNTNKTEIKEEYQYGDEKNIKTSSEIETTLYESARTRAYSLKLTDGFTGLVIYGVLVYYAWRFAFMYLKRVLNIMILTLLAPAVSASYAFNKVMTGKSKIFSTWLSEYVMNVIIQIVHVIVYVAFVSMALELSLVSLSGTILTFVLLNFMTKADKILRQLFKLSGGKGSLAGSMAQSKLKDLSDELKGVGSAVMGGKYTKMAAGLTYRVATKPVRAVGEYAFGKAMEHRANSSKYIEEKNKEEEAELAEIEEDREAFFNGKVQSVKSAELLAEREELESQLNQAEQAKNNKKVEQLEAKLEENQDSLEEEFIKYYQRRGEDLSLLDIAKEGIKNAFDPRDYLELDPREGREGKYTKNRYVWDEKKGKFKRVPKTIREGGNPYAFWRKKEDGIGKKFFNNMKFSNLMGITDAEKKILKAESKFWGSTIMGLMSAIAGLPALGVNPLLGMGLLSKATMSRMDIKTRMRNLKARPSYRKAKYYYKSFGSGAEKAIADQAMLEINGAESKLTKNNMKNHSKLTQMLLTTTTVVTKPIVVAGLTLSGVALGTGITSAKGGISGFSGRLTNLTFMERDKMNGAYQKKLRTAFKAAKKDYIYLNARTLSKEYEAGLEEYEKEQTKSASEKDVTELIFRDKLSDENTIAIRNHIVEIQADDEMNKFIDKIDSMKDIQDKTQRINQIKSELMKNETKLIENSITKLCVSKGITNIENLKLDDTDNIEIQKNVLGILEERGVIKKGEITLNDELISDKKIRDVYKDLNKNKENANQSIEERLTNDAILEYMAKENITDVKKLKETETKEKIYDIIKEKHMSDASKSSADVINQLSGQDKLREEIDVEEFMKENTDNALEKVKVTSKVKLSAQAIKMNKENLIRRETNRNVNQTKNKLEAYMCTENDELLENEYEVKLATLLEEVGRQNKKAQKANMVNVRDDDTLENKARIKYYQKKNRNKQNLNNVETKVHGPVVDIIDLINRI